MMFKWCDLGRMPKCLLIGWKHGMPWHASSFNNQWRVKAWSGQLRQNLKV